jgi:multidrug efflux system membrane fusion protein
VKLKAVFDNTDGALFPNQFVNARLTLMTLDDQLLIPASAVQRGTPGTFVYVVNADATATVRPIVLGASSGDTVAVERGLKADERVVVDGTDKLREGAKVEAAVEAPTPAARGRGGHGGHGQWKPRGDGKGGPPGGPTGGVPADGQHRRHASGDSNP